MNSRDLTRGQRHKTQLSKLQFQMSQFSEPEILSNKKKKKT